MLFIIGSDSILRGLADAFLPSPARDAVWRQLGHCPWEGLSFYDLIFPLFVFISGVSLFLSLTKASQRGKKSSSLLAELWLRAFFLALYGFLINATAGGDFCRARPDTWRFASVLGLIGISCALAGSVMVLLRRFFFAPLIAAAILLSVGLLQHFGGDMSPTACFNARVDALLCPGVLHHVYTDPEGPLCIISASALALLGYSTGWLLSSSLSHPRQLTSLTLSGVTLIGIGSLCGPIIKNIWTPAFVLTTAGISSLLLLLFRVCCDLSRRGASLSFPLRVIGTNSLFVYLFTHVLGVEGWCARGIRSLLPHCSYSLQSSLAGLLCLTISFLACFILYSYRQHRHSSPSLRRN